MFGTWYGDSRSIPIRLTRVRVNDDSRVLQEKLKVVLVTRSKNELEERILERESWVGQMTTILLEFSVRRLYTLEQVRDEENKRDDWKGSRSSESSLNLNESYVDASYIIHD